MYKETLSNNLIASKNLSRIWPRTEGNLMNIETGWCRMIYSEYDEFIKKPHKHSFYEIHCMIKGELDFMIDNKEYEVHEGEFIVLAPNFEHSAFRVSPDSQKFVFSFGVEPKCDFVVNALNEIKRETVIYRTSPHIYALIRMMMDYSFSYSSITREVVSKLSECLLVDFFNQIYPASEDTIESLAVFESDLRVDEMEKYVKENICNGISVADVANYLNLSPRQLDRISKKNTGYTTFQFIANEKMKYIKELLRSDIQLSQIAEKMNFSSEYSLYRFFMRNEGRSIGTFRKDMEKPFIDNKDKNFDAKEKK